MAEVILLIDGQEKKFNFEPITWGKLTEARAESIVLKEVSDEKGKNRYLPYRDLEKYENLLIVKSIQEENFTYETLYKLPAKEGFKLVELFKTLNPELNEIRR